MKREDIINFIISTSKGCNRNEQYKFVNNEDDIVERKINMLKILKLMTDAELDNIMSEIIDENEDDNLNYFNLLTSTTIINKIKNMKRIIVDEIDNYYHFNL